MIYYFANNMQEQCSNIDSELENNIKLQNAKLDTLFNLLLNVYTISETSEDSTFEANLFKDIKDISDALKENIASLQNLSEIFGSIKSKVKKKNVKMSEELSATITNYNELVKDAQTQAVSCDEQYFNFINNYLKLFIPKPDLNLPESGDLVALLKKKLGNSLEESLENSSENTVNYEEKKESEKLEKNTSDENNNDSTDDGVKDEDNDNDPKHHKSNKDKRKKNKNKKNDNEIGKNEPSEKNTAPSASEIKDNRVLLISEKDKKVYLPYNVVDLEQALKDNSKYSTLQEVIDNDYTIPLSKYNGAVQSRFRETFNLMRKKSHSSLFESLDLSLELAFNNLLNPAIITACKNIDELDIYLDCLSSGELDKFDIFTVEYEFAPSKV